MKLAKPIRSRMVPKTNTAINATVNGKSSTFTVISEEMKNIRQPVTKKMIPGTAKLVRARIFFQSYEFHLLERNSL